MLIGIAADHRGFTLKEKIKEYLLELDFELMDFGAYELHARDDYPDFVIPLAQAVAQGAISRGIAICGSGIGACIAANKVRNVRAGVVEDLFSARQGVEDDNMNVICLGARLVEFRMAIELIEYFLSTKFTKKSRYRRRLAKIANLEGAAR